MAASGSGGGSGSESGGEATAAAPLAVLATAAPREEFWRAWGLVTVFSCSACHVHFPAREQLHCSFHPAGAPAFPLGETGPGAYPCCGVSGDMGAAVARHLPKACSISQAHSGYTESSRAPLPRSPLLACPPTQRPAWRPGQPLGLSAGCCAAAHHVALPPGCGGDEDRSGPPQATVVGCDLYSSYSCEGASDRGAVGAAPDGTDEAAAMRRLRCPRRALQLLRAFGGLAAAPYAPPPLPPGLALQGLGEQLSSRRRPLLCLLTQGHGPSPPEGQPARPEVAGWSEADLAARRRRVGEAVAAARAAARRRAPPVGSAAAPAAGAAAPRTAEAAAGALGAMGAGFSHGGRCG
jgi:hypothetical protein